MNLPRLFPPALALCALLLAACGNKADLFMPPPPEDAEDVDPWQGEDPFDDAADGEPPAAEAVSPVPAPTGAEPARTPIPPIDDDNPDPPPSDPFDDE